MDNLKTIFILSDNRDFIEPLSSLVTRELGISCSAISSEAEISETDTQLLVTDRILASSYTFHIIMVNLPIRLKMLLADIEAAIASPVTIDVLDIGSDSQLTLQRKTLTHKSSGVEVALTDKESHLLQVISQAGDAGITRESLMKEVWGIDLALDTHTLETHIYRLRKKIRDSFDVEMIKAFEGGYRL